MNQESGMPVDAPTRAVPVIDSVRCTDDLAALVTMCGAGAGRCQVCARSLPE